MKGRLRRHQPRTKRNRTTRSPAAPILQRRPVGWERGMNTREGSSHSMRLTTHRIRAESSAQAEPPSTSVDAHTGTGGKLDIELPTDGPNHGQTLRGAELRVAGGDFSSRVEARPDRKVRASDVGELLDAKGRERRFERVCRGRVKQRASAYGTASR